MHTGSARVREGCDLQTGKVETGWSKGCYLDIIPIIPGKPCVAGAWDILRHPLRGLFPVCGHEDSVI